MAWFRVLLTECASGRRTIRVVLIGFSLGMFTHTTNLQFLFGLASILPNNSRGLRGLRPTRPEILGEIDQVRACRKFLSFGVALELPNFLWSIFSFVRTRLDIPILDASENQ